MRYKLHDALGGAEVEGSVTPFGLLVVHHPDGRPDLVVGSWWFTPIAPPLPEEPPLMSVVFVASEDSWGLVFRRYTTGWTEPGRDADAPGFNYLEWAKVCAMGTPVRLVPAPEPVEPVTLPWEFVDADGDEITVDKDGVVRVFGVAVLMTDDSRRAMAAALLSAAGGVG